MDTTDLARIDADTVLDRYLGSRFPVDSVALAVTMGMESYWMNNTDLASIATKKPDGPRIVGTNQYESTSRQRFACAHAIGHHMEQHTRQLRHGYIFHCYQFDFNNWIAPEELYANTFATNLLMPPDVLEDLARDHDTKELAEFFDVTMKIVRYHAATLRIHVKPMYL